MATVLVTTDFGTAEGIFSFSMDVQGNGEMEHEVLAALFASPRSVTLNPAHNGDELFIEFTITDKTVFAKAKRAVENRHRIADGKPTIEQEEAAAKAVDDAQRANAAAAQRANAAAAQRANAAAAQAAQDSADERIARIASKAAADERIARIASKAAAETVTQLMASKK